VLRQDPTRDAVEGRNYQRSFATIRKRLKKHTGSCRIRSMTRISALDSLQSLATEVAMTYGVLRYHPAAFDQSDKPHRRRRMRLTRSVGAIHFLKKNAGDDCDSSGGLRWMPVNEFRGFTYTPSIWPVLGHIRDSFGERLDPFSGEGAFYRAWSIVRLWRAGFTPPQTGDHHR